MAPAIQRQRRIPSVAGATTALVLLTALNFVNYIDRYILPGVQEQVKGEFHVSDAQIGSLTFYFFFTYMSAAPLTGWLGDRYARKPLIIGCALLVISAINVLTGTVHAFDSLLLRHALSSASAKPASESLRPPCSPTSTPRKTATASSPTTLYRDPRRRGASATSSPRLSAAASAGACRSTSPLCRAC